MAILGRKRVRRAWLAVSWLSAALVGCHAIPVNTHVQSESAVSANFNGKLDVHLPLTPDPGPMVPEVVRAGSSGPHSARVAIIDVDGLLVNQNLTGLYSQGENPAAAFREKLEASACDPRVRAVVLRINSPGGGVAASDLMAEELRRFRAATNKPVVSCLLDLATGGAYYLAVGGDRIIAQPTSVTGAVGALINHANLSNAMGQLGLKLDTVKAGPLIDMGTVAEELDEPARRILQQMADGYRERYFARLADRRTAMSASDRQAIADGRIVPAMLALRLHMLDGLGYLDDGIAEAERLAGASGSEVVLFHRAGTPAHSIYAIAPNTPLQGDLIPVSYPSLDRAKLPTFLYLWQPDPVIARVPGR
jgi:protease-4